MAVLGVIGGSGLYDLEGLEDVRFEAVESPFGTPSDLIVRGRLGDHELAFLPRHGRGHRLMPSGINYRANIDALKRLGVTDILSLSACGSLREDFAPGDFVLVDQFIDRTRARASSFFGNGLVAHVSMAEPTCRRLRQAVADVAQTLDIRVHDGGTYVVVEGPQFSSRAESELYRAWGADIIGMTNLPEAKLAREAEICYLSVGMVTDYDCWHDDHAAVEVAHVLRILEANAAAARQLVAAAAPAILSRRPDVCPAGCDRALENAIVTAAEMRDGGLVARLDAVAGRVLGRGP
ncbi:MAG: S-methyl-5'-thioadenosine phosphorylase [Alphaproteobacteria bacterium]|nr:MAG: S-methyl-5'-thioadenosine phosphorylase [Alphaproteobacteria bacterium]